MEIAAVMLRFVGRDGGIDRHAADRIEHGGGSGGGRGRIRRVMMIVMLVHLRYLFTAGQVLDLPAGGRSSLI